MSDEQIKNLQESCNTILSVDVRSFPRELLRMNTMKVAIPFLMHAQEFARTLDELGLENAKYLEEEQVMTLNGALRLVSEGFGDVTRILNTPLEDSKETQKAASNVLRVAKEAYETVTDFRDSNMRIYSRFYSRQK